MAAVDTARVRNLESSILFLQQEHANTLKCLHEEIRKLQKKNSDMTFRLEMGPTVSSQPDLEGRVRELNLEVDSWRQQVDKVTRDKDKQIHTLEKQIKQQEKSFREELKTYSSKFRKYQQELTAKADTIAELQLKLYSANTMSGRRSSDSPRLVPTPPKEGAPRARRGSRRSMVPIDAKDRPLSSGGCKDYVLDPTPFLIPAVDPPQKQRQEPLPPINQQERTKSPLVREAEVVEFALGSVQKSESWRHAPSHSGNFK